MTPLLQIISMTAVFACAWRLVVCSPIYSQSHSLKKHFLGATTAVVAFLFSALLFAWGYDWIVYCVALCMAWVAHKGKSTQTTVVLQVVEPMPVVVPKLVVFRHQMPDTMDAHSSRGHARSLGDWGKDMTPVWSGQVRIIRFAYEDANGDSSRRSVDVDEISEDQDGTFYLSGHCHTRNERRTFRVDRITSKIAEYGHKREPYQWLSEVIGREL